MPSNLRRVADDLALMDARAGTASKRSAETGAIEFATTIEGAVREADLIIDCVPDELESKLEIFSLLDRMAPPQAIFGTLTVALSIGDLASCTYRPGRCVAFALNSRFVSGEDLPESIEIVRTEKTDSDVLESVLSYWAALGCSTTVRTDDWQFAPVPASRQF